MCELVYVDRIVNGKNESLLVMDSYYRTWLGCYCKI